MESLAESRALLRKKSPPGFPAETVSGGFYRVWSNVIDSAICWYSPWRAFSSTSFAEISKFSATGSRLMFFLRKRGNSTRRLPGVTAMRLPRQIADSQICAVLQGIHTAAAC
jgi:hypothetical protein